ncbi:hypothetical protein DAEQUDRAFT_719917 [Daedalea quercina L-15889]|uniref:G-protein coupled receptors family 3 profile domain-containing protein n=1 Tax=Daedalea quercina L-15889 TaxID=1314783 RepID=A0A165UD73_9APHY|nr:hypothetical protein DAEQUDRAFT_719917 [Daedalea quercina L-15889]
MFTGTSLAHSAAATVSWQSATIASLHMPPSTTGTPALTTITDAQILPFPAPTAPASAAPVVINLNAQVTLLHDDDFYDAPLPSFRPVYYATRDGSLLSQDYLDEMTVSKAPVFVMGAVCLFFLRNSRKSLLFLRRAKVKDRTLFYLLVFSQFLGLAGSIVGSVGLLDMRVSCYTIGVIYNVLAKLSADTMVTGIIGVKAYRCLGNNRLVLLFLFVVTVAMWTMEGLDVANYSAHRSRYGICEDTHPSGYLSRVVLISFIETALLCGCFLLAVWKSYRTRTDGRVTISADDCKLYERNDAKDTIEAAQAPRGWWDYVPDAHISSADCSSCRPRAIMHAITECFRRLWSTDDFPSGIVYQRKPSLPGEFPLPQPPRRSAPGHTCLRSTLPCFTQLSCCSWVSGMRRWGRHVFGRQSFPRMLRNELFYTTMIASVFMGLSIALLVGIHSNTPFDTERWVKLDWVIVSVFTMNSFSRVVRRHELESVLQHPAAWNRMLRTNADYSKVFYGPRLRRTRPSDDSSPSRSPPRSRSERFDDGSASFRPNYPPSQDAPLSSYTVSPITPSTSRKLSAASSLPSLPFQQPLSPHDSPPRTPISEFLAPLPYSPPSPTASFSRFSFTTDTRPDVQRLSTNMEPSRSPLDSRRFSLDAWTNQRTSNDSMDPSRLSRNSS